MAILLPSIEAVLEPSKFHCATCIMQYGGTKRTMAKAETKRRSKGCYDYGIMDYRLENIKYDRCVGNYVKNIEYFTDAFSLYEKGILPFEGTLGDQPNKIMEIFELIHRRRAEFMKREEAKKPKDKK